MRQSSSKMLNYAGFSWPNVGVLKLPLTNSNYSLLLYSKTNVNYQYFRKSKGSSFHFVECLYWLIGGHTLDNKIIKYLKIDKWYHGTSLYGWKKMCELQVQADYNKGHELDFGYGFYLTFKDQAEYYITNLIKYSANLPGVPEDKKIPVVIEFNFCPYDWYNENTFKFEILNTYDDRFAEFVFHNRINNVFGENQHDFDVIFGVMSDSVPTVLIQRYKSKEINKAEVIQELKKSTRNKQISLHNQKLCDRIKPTKAYNIVTGKELDIDDYFNR